MIGVAPLVGANAVIFCHNIPVIIALATNGPAVRYSVCVGDVIRAAGYVTALGDVVDGELDIYVFHGEVVCGGDDLCISGDKSRIVYNDLV